MADGRTVIDVRALGESGNRVRGGVPRSGRAKVGSWGTVIPDLV